jgi:hypothetical protein
VRSRGVTAAGLEAVVSGLSSVRSPLPAARGLAVAGSEHGSIASDRKGNSGFFKNKVHFPSQNFYLAYVSLSYILFIFINIYGIDCKIKFKKNSKSLRSLNSFLL